MTGFDVVHDAVTDAVGAVRAATGRLQADRDLLRREVAQLLDGSWSGAAAASFQEAFDDWLVGAAAVIDGLDTMGELLAATDARYVAVDEQIAQQVGAVTGRITARLG